MSVEKLFERATRIAIDPACTDQENVRRALALGIMTMRVLEQEGESAAKSILLAAATTKQHKAAGRELDID